MAKSDVSVPVMITEIALTKREYFAAMAMQGLLSNPNVDYPCLTEVDTARDAYKYADAMIKEGEK